MAFFFSPLAYFLLRKPPESQRKLQKVCTGGVVPILGRIDTRRIVVSEYMLYAWTALFSPWTALFSQVLRVGVATPF